MANSALVEYLRELFSLKSQDQVESVPFDAVAGKESVPYRFTIHLDNGAERKVFVKKVSWEGIDQIMEGTDRIVDALEWEAGFYKNFLPEIRSFLETHEGMTDEIIDSCFVKYYGYTESGGECFLVLQDISEKQCQVPRKIPANLLVEARAILQKLGTLYGIFYVWKEEKTRRKADEHPFESFVSLDITKKCMVNGNKVLRNICSSSATVKIAKLLLNSTARKHSQLKARCDLDTLEKLERWVLNQDPITLVEKVLITENNLWCPIFGDVQPLNIAISDKIDKVVFFDFTHFMLGSVMQDFQRYMGICVSLDSSLEELLEVYIDSFIASTARFKVVVSRDQLIADYHRTMYNYIRWRIAIYSLRLMKNTDLFKKVSEADISTAEGEATVLEILERYPQHWADINGLLEFVNKSDQELSRRSYRY